MKIFIYVTVLLFSNFVFAQNVAGTWVWTAAGCRDASSLSAESHVTKPKKGNPFRVAASQLTLNSDNSASMRIELQQGATTDGGSQTQNETGSWRMDGNRLTLIDGEPVMVMHLINGDLILNYADSGDDSTEENERLCGSAGKTYVYVFSSV